MYLVPHVLVLVRRVCRHRIPGLGAVRIVPGFTVLVPIPDHPPASPPLGLAFARGFAETAVMQRRCVRTLPTLPEVDRFAQCRDPVETSLLALPLPKPAGTAD